MAEHECQEKIEFGTLVFDCGAPAHVLVQHRGRAEGPYWMCPPHASHNIQNRDAEDITPEAERVRTFTTVTTGAVHGCGYRIDDRLMSRVYEFLANMERANGRVAEVLAGCECGPLETCSVCRPELK